MDYLCIENKKLKEKIDEKTISLDMFENEMKKFKYQNFKLKNEITGLKKVKIHRISKY